MFSLQSFTRIIPIFSGNIFYMKTLLRLTMTSCLACCLTLVNGELRLPAIIGSNMVLQQKTEVKFWGWGNPGEKVKIKAGWKTGIDSTVCSRDGNWSVLVKTPMAGGSFSISIEGDNKIIIENVLIGEVWLCSGQSNMEWSALNNNKQAITEAPSATNNQIRFFHIPKSTSDHPQDDLKAGWKVCNPEDMKKFSIVGYFFGKKLNKELSVPVGLINASWGGTPAEVWTPKEIFVEDAGLSEASRKIGVNPWWPHIPGKTFNAMLHPITNFSIAGAIWYQGESNSSTAYMYTKLLSSMINSWRRYWAIDFPFYYVQIAPFAYGKEYQGALLREAQSKLDVSNTGMVVISDLVDDIQDIHPQNKLDVANRLADMALAKTYQKKSGPYKYPIYKSMKVEANKVMIEFDNAETGLMSKEGDPKDFELAGADQVFYPAQAKITGNTITVQAKEVKQPVAVRFGFKNKSMPNLFSKEGLPVNLFRTDNWPIQ